MSEKEKVFLYNDTAFSLSLHTSVEHYKINKLTIEARASRELKNLINSKVERHYASGKFYKVEPCYVISVRSEAASDPKILGRVVDFKKQGTTKRDAGSAQAWFYPTTKDAVIWECIAHKDPFAKQTSRAEEHTELQIFWNVWEETLEELWPRAKRWWTPGWDPLYDQKFYEQFLRDHGFRPYNHILWLKSL